MVYSYLVDSLEFEGNVYLIDDFKFDLTIDEIKNTDHNMTLEKYYDAIKDIFQDGDIIVGYSLSCIFALLIVEKLEKDSQIGKCILIDGTLEFYNYEVPDKEEALTAINELYDMGFDVDELGPDHDELMDKMMEMFVVNSKWDFPTAKINDTPVIYLAADQQYDEGRLEDIARDAEFILIEDTDHTAIVTTDALKIVRYLK
ncbi:hypothetical protein [Methanobrevibacter sp.]|uniref:hypothetical protein n=1 Tax=Methanobrevibacter sp. TaxID=66852 RepID=UPI00386FB166